MSRKVKSTAPAAVATDPVERSWVDAVKDPRQRALARAIPDICAVFGVSASDLGARTASKGDKLAVVRGAHRKFAIGMIAHAGRALTLHWNDMHARVQGEAQPGTTEILDLAPIHRHSLSQFSAQFAVFAGLSKEDGTAAGPPVGELGRFAHDRYVQILRSVTAEATHV